MLWRFSSKVITTNTNWWNTKSLSLKEHLAMQISWHLSKKWQLVSVLASIPCNLSLVINMLGQCQEVSWLTLMPSVLQRLTINPDSTKSPSPSPLPLVRRRRPNKSWRWWMWLPKQPSTSKTHLCWKDRMEWWPMSVNIIPPTSNGCSIAERMFFLSMWKSKNKKTTRLISRCNSQECTMWPSRHAMKWVWTKFHSNAVWLLLMPTQRAV